MKMKGITAGLVFTFILLALPTNSFAAVKAGSACPKLKMISVSGGKVYTCIKSGKKLVWDKGSVISKPTASDPQPTPSNTAAPITEAAQVGSKCTKQGDTGNSGDKKLICRLTASGNKYFEFLHDGQQPEVSRFFNNMPPD